MATQPILNRKSTILNPTVLAMLLIAWLVPAARAEEPDHLTQYARETWQLRERMAVDPHRPVYHFLAPIGWMNDPNGPIYFRGEYHLFYQHHVPPGRKPIWDAQCWGHAKSKDLVHWTDLPIAMRPDTQHDRNGVYSGNIVINDEGIPTAIYTGNVRGHAETYAIMATSTDGMVTWKKRTVITKPPYKGTPVNWDSQVWKDGDTWYLLSGGCYQGGGAAVLWSSPNLIDWTYRSRIYTTKKYGKFWELPYLIPLGDRHVLILGVWPTRYWIGTYDKKRFVFTPDKPEAEILDYSTRYYSPNPHLFDDKGPGGSRRRILLGWVLGGSPTKNVPYWDSLHSLPRVLTLEKGRLVQTPVPELKKLRTGHVHLGRQKIDSPKPGLLRGSRGDAVEIIARFDRRGATAKRFGVRLRTSADGKEGAVVYYEPATDTFGVAGSVATPRKGAAGLKSAKQIEMRIFLDRSVLEVFVGGRVITERLYPKPGNQGLDVFAQGGAVTLDSLDLWRMKPVWPTGRKEEGKR